MISAQYGNIALDLSVIWVVSPHLGVSLIIADPRLVTMGFNTKLVEFKDDLVWGTPLPILRNPQFKSAKWNLS